MKNGENKRRRNIDDGKHGLTLGYSVSARRDRIYHYTGTICSGGGLVQPTLGGVAGRPQRIMHGGEYRVK